MRTTAAMKMARKPPILSSLAPEVVRADGEPAVVELEYADATGFMVDAAGAAAPVALLPASSTGQTVV